MVYFTEISSHPDQGDFASRNAERRKTPVFERSDAQKHVESGGGVTCNEISDMRKNSRGEQG